MQGKNRNINGIKNKIEHTKLLCFAGALLTACFLCGCTRKEELLILTKDAEASPLISEETVMPQRAEVPEEGMPANKVQQEPVESSPIYVHVCGAVKEPGVYELPAGSRVYEAVEAAGGFSGKADQNYVNQAQILGDGVKLVIPTTEEAVMAKGTVADDGKETDFGAAAGERNEAALQIGILENNDALQKDAVGQPRTESAIQADGKVNINTATKQELCGIPGVGETRAAAIISYRESHGGFAKPEDIMKVSGIKEGMYNKIKDSISVE